MKKAKIERGSRFDILTANYQSRYRYLERELVYLEREHHYEEPTIQIETFASAWLVAFAGSSMDHIGVRSGGDIVRTKGPAAIFLPPFKLVEWHIGRGTLKWSAYISTMPLPTNLPQRPMLFSGHGKMPNTKEDLFKVLQEAENVRPIDEGRNSSVSALRVKQFIDGHFKEALQIGEVAQALGMPRSHMARTFKKTYGISPVLYRHKIRVYEALNYMTMRGFDVTDALFECGFSDPNQFIDHFKGIFGVTPAEYSPLRKMKSAKKRVVDPSLAF